MHATRHRAGSLVATLAVAVLCGLAAPLAAKTKLLENIPLQWKPTTTAAELKMPPIDLTKFEGVKVVVEPFVNKMADPQKIGENREEEKEPPKPVTTSDNVGTWASTRTAAFLKDMGVEVVPDHGTSVVGGEVEQFFVTETGTYEAEVRMKVTIKSPAGTVRWAGMAVGSAKRFGRSYKAENYYEVLSDAMLDALAHVFSAQPALDALSSKKH